MAEYRVLFVRSEGLRESDVGPAYGLAAKDRKEAEAEALQLRAPEGANFIKLIRDGLFEHPKIGFAL